MNALYDLMALAARPQGHVVTGDTPTLQIAARHLAGLGLMQVTPRSDRSMFVQLTEPGRRLLLSERIKYPPRTIEEVIERARVHRHREAA